MKIIVCMKQVPDTADIKWTEKNTMQREGVEAVINPFDEFALETALKIKDCNKNVEVVALSMGPTQAKEMLKRAIAYGVDEGILLSDKKFAGADTYATAKTLAYAIKNKISDFDLIICGQFATDGDTGQTGPALASFLNIAQVTYVKDVCFNEKSELIVTKETETTFERLKVKMPAVLCVQKSDCRLRPALIDGYIKAHNQDIKVLSLEDIKIDATEVGFKGSPTYVSAAFKPEHKKIGTIIERKSSDEYALFLDDKVNELKERFCIND